MIVRLYSQVPVPEVKIWQITQRKSNIWTHLVKTHSFSTVFGSLLTCLLICFTLITIVFGCLGRSSVLTSYKDQWNMSDNKLTGRENRRRYKTLWLSSDSVTQHGINSCGMKPGGRLSGLQLEDAVSRMWDATRPSSVYVFAVQRLNWCMRAAFDH